MSTKIRVYDKDAVGEQIEEYLELGLMPIPLKGKIAAYPWRTFILAGKNIERYLTPEVNWELRTGKLECGLWFYAIDLDRKDLLTAMYDHCPVLMEAPTVSTGKGFHIYLTWTEEVKTRHFAGVDVIGNGYVVAPPSIHPSGKPYVFIRPLESVPPIFNPKSLELKGREKPSPFLASNFPDKSAVKSSDMPVGQFMSVGVPQGQRHNMLVHYLGILFNACMPEDMSLTKALEWNRLNNPPLSVDEVKYTVRSCYEKWDKVC